MLGWACRAEKIEKYAPMGVDGFTLGTTLLFGKKTSYKEIIQHTRKMDFSYHEHETTCNNYMS